LVTEVCVLILCYVRWSTYVLEVQVKKILCPGTWHLEAWMNNSTIRKVTTTNKTHKQTVLVCVQL